MAWPRTVKPHRMSFPAAPSAIMARSQGGKYTTRGGITVGRVWQESYAIKTSEVGPAALLATINQFFHDGTFFDIDCQLRLTPLGVGGGSPLVAGASQTGATINVDAAPVSTTNWLRQGDIVKFAGLNLVYEVTGDVTTDGGGLAAIGISPSIVAGESPADDAAVTITGVLYRALILDVEMPTVPAHEFGLCVVTFGEAK